MSDFLEDTKTAFLELLNRGDMRIVSDHYDPEVFGNAVVVLEGRGFHLRLSRDRGDVVAEIAASNAPEEWTPLERALLAVGAARVPDEGLLTPAEAADLVRENLALLETGFCQEKIDETLRRIEALGRWRLAAAIRRFGAGPDVTGE